MIKPFMLAQITLKAYAVAFILLLLIPPPLIIPFKLFNVIVSAITIGIVFVLLSISKGLSKGTVWAYVFSCIVFIGFAALTFLLLINSVENKDYSSYFWIQLWLISMSIFGLVGLIVQGSQKVQKKTNE